MSWATQPPSVEALVYRGVSLPGVCHRVQDDSVAERQPCACGWCVSCHLVSACERVRKLVLCDGVLHRETAILNHVLWHVATPAHSAQNLFENIHCSVSWETFHSNSIGSPSIPNCSVSIELLEISKLILPLLFGF